MIAYDLICMDGHRFESWFRSGDAFERQQAEEAIVCPICGDRGVSKAPMAPHVARSSGSADSLPAPAEFVEMLGRLRQHVASTCDYVGTAFPEEARRIHYGEVDPRSIYGEASGEEAAALKEEGIEAYRIPWPRLDG